MIPLRALFLLASLSASLQAQVTSIPYTVTCAACRVTTEPVVTLGSASDSVPLDGGVGLARDSRGRYYTTGFGGKSIVIFDSTGKYLQAFGRAGQGPGEFAGRIMGLSVKADTLYTFTVSGHRVTVFSPSLAFVRTATYLPVTMHSAPTMSGSRGEFIASGEVRSSDSLTQYKYHVVGGDGKRIRSFGNAYPIVSGRPPAIRPTTTVVATLMFALSPMGDQLWTGNNEYRVTRWDVATGSSTTFQVADVPWLRNAPPPPDRETLRDDLGAAMTAIAAGLPQPPHKYPPRPSASLMRVDDQQRLWMWSYVHFNNDARPAGPLSSCRGIESSLYPGWRSCVLLEVVDTRRRVLLMSQLFDTNGQFIPYTDLMYSKVQDANGVTTLKVVRVRLVGAP